MRVALTQSEPTRLARCLADAGFETVEKRFGNGGIVRVVTDRPGEDSFAAALAIDVGRAAATHGELQLAAGEGGEQITTAAALRIMRARRSKCRRGPGCRTSQVGSS